MNVRFRWIRHATVACAMAALSPVLLATFAAASSIPRAWSREWCSDDDYSGQPMSCVVRVIKVDRVPDVLRVDPGDNGGVEVAAGDDAGIKVSARIRAWGKTESERNDLISKVRITNDTAGLHASGPSSQGEGNSKAGWCVNFRITVPARTALELNSQNGPLAIYGMKGRSVLRAQNGPIAIVHAGGDVTADTQNGPLQVTLEGTRWDGKGLTARASNGPVELAIPHDFNADLTTGTMNGPWVGRHEMVVADKQTYKHEKLGSGGPPILVTTVNGPFVEKRGEQESE
jgi:hypothetical protein